MSDLTCDLRHGRYQDVLGDVECDICIPDGPYSATTHTGHNDGVNGDQFRRALDYSHWTPDDARECVAWAVERARWWFITITDDLLAPHYRLALRDHGWLDFATVPWIARRKRNWGDGPPSWSCSIIVGRPRLPRYVNAWHQLPGAYDVPQDTDAGIGGKPVALLAQILSDYTRKLPDDHPTPVVCDPTSGERPTTALACRKLGFHFVGAEVDEEKHRKASARLGLIDTSSELPLFGGP